MKKNNKKKIQKLMLEIKYYLALKLCYFKNKNVIYLFIKYIIILEQSLNEKNASIKQFIDNIIV